MRKHNGVYYTPYSVAYRIVSDVLAVNPPAIERTFLEPCAGNGIFVIAYLDYVIATLHLSDEASIQQLLAHVYCADIDPIALQLLKLSTEQYLATKYHISVTLPEDNLYVGNAIYQSHENGIVKVDLRHVFEAPEGFDYVFTNPPYKLLKANANKYRGEAADRHRHELQHIIRFLKNGRYYPLSQGALNLYKLFCEDIVTRYMKPGGGVGLLVPQTILNDKNTAALRKHILNAYQLTKVYIIPEQATFFSGITQAFCLFGFNDVARQNRRFEVIDGVCTAKDFTKKGYRSSEKKLGHVSVLEPIVSTDKTGYAILQKLHRHPSIREHHAITNLRGELDLTFHKAYITAAPTALNLVRGSHIGALRTKPTTEHVDSLFLAKTAKAQYVTADRIICQQISNLQAAHRLKFALAPKNSILANSVNFLHLGAHSSHSLTSLLAIMNSSILDWRFRLTSSNNHINNYELDDLPVPVVTHDQRTQLEQCLDAVTAVDLEQTMRSIDAVAAEIFGLSPSDVAYIRAQRSNESV